MSKRSAYQRLARIDAQEATYARKIRLVLMRQVELSAAAIEQGASPEIAAAYVSAAALKPALTSLWMQVIVQEARYQHQELVGETKAAPVGPLSDWLQKAKNYVQVEGTIAITRITQTTRKLVRGVLDTALQQGMGAKQAARELRKVASFSTKRAVTIARTELIAAANYGSFTGAASTGLDLNKVWLATSDGKTRTDHSIANGQVVALQGSFAVGGELGQYPGDPSLSARQRCRCRCTVTYQRKPEL